MMVVIDCGGGGGDDDHDTEESDPLDVLIDVTNVVPLKNAEISSLGCEYVRRSISWHNGLKH